MGEYYRKELLKIAGKVTAASYIAHTVSKDEALAIKLAEVVKEINDIVEDSLQ